jgi:hypothetical protein
MNSAVAWLIGSALVASLVLAPLAFPASLDQETHQFTQQALESIASQPRFIELLRAVEWIRMAPLGKQSVVAIAAPALLPMIPVVAIEAPVKETLLKLLGALI